MSEGVGADFVKIGERFLEGVPGFALVAIGVGIALPFALPAKPETSTEPEGAFTIARQLLPVIAFVIAWTGHFLGHYLDDVIFDPVWGVPGISKSSLRARKILFFEKLHTSRASLAGLWQRPITGIFAKAEQVARNTEAWEKKIKWPLEWSKAFRSFAIIGLMALFLQLRLSWIVSAFLLSFIWFLVEKRSLWPSARKDRDFWTSLKSLLFGFTMACLLIASVLQMPKEKISLRPAPPVLLLSASIIFAGCYVALRICHMFRLYTESPKIELDRRDGMFCAGSKVLPARNVLLCIDSSVRREHFEQADRFLQSRALLHVNLKTNQTTIAVPLQYRKRLLLYNDQLQKVAVHDANLPHSPAFDPCHDVAFDLVVDFVNRAAPTPLDLEELMAGLNGVL
jgi:hypothetical protein